MIVLERGPELDIPLLVIPPNHTSRIAPLLLSSSLTTFARV